MADSKTIKQAYERNRKAINLRPSLGKGSAVTKVRLSNGTTCEVEHKHWKFKVDIGTSEGGNDAGPGPGILERGALGSCLAIAYSQQAAVRNVPIESIEVDVESDMDASGMFGISSNPPGFKEMRYKVYIQSSASEEDVQELIDWADEHSPVLDDFKRAIPVKREVYINEGQEAE
ncbi:MAG: OsmC family protein [Balneolaceae bacterium]